MVIPRRPTTTGVGMQNAAFRPRTVQACRFAFGTSMASDCIVDTDQSCRWVALVGRYGSNAARGISATLFPRPPLLLVARSSQLRLCHLRAYGLRANRAHDSSFDQPIDAAFRSGCDPRSASDRLSSHSSGKGQG